LQDSSAEQVAADIIATATCITEHARGF
jgi:hypothetical protein